MMRIADGLLIVIRHGQAIELEELELNFQVRALVSVGYDPELARIFGFSNGERSKVIALGKRRRILL